jgi:hypothetical protein
VSKRSGAIDDRLLLEKSEEVGGRTKPEFDFEQELSCGAARGLPQPGLVHEDTDLLIRRSSDREMLGVLADATVNLRRVRASATQAASYSPKAWIDSGRRGHLLRSVPRDSGGSVSASTQIAVALATVCCKLNTRSTT